MERLAGEDQRVDGVGRHGGLRESAENELELARIARHVADGDVSAEMPWRLVCAVAGSMVMWR